jgi:cysteine desulfurase/selenocysteine lyase
MAQPLKQPTGQTFDPATVRGNFPALAQTVHGHPLAYLDNAASAQTPRSVLEAMEIFYTRDRSNVHRGVHALSQRATVAYEDAREKVARHLGADPGEIVFVRGTTEAINLVASSFAAPRLEPGDEILITHLEHHANIVPWQLICEATGARLRVTPINDAGEVELEAFVERLGPRTRLAAFAHISNALGTVLPIEGMIAAARQRGVPTLVDGAQAVPHEPVDVVRLGCDFYALSGHKMFGPTGIGVLYGRRSHLDTMRPYQGGGDMIASVSFEGTRFREPPHRFEAGTPAIAEAIGLGATVDYLENLDRAAAARHEAALLDRATAAVASLPGARLIGTARERVGVLSFVLEGVHPHDIATILDQHGVAIRAGHHCAQPLMERFQLPATARASFAFYNTPDEVDALLEGLREAVEIFA